MLYSMDCVSLDLVCLDFCGGSSIDLASRKLKVFALLPFVLLLNVLREFNAGNNANTYSSIRTCIIVL